MVGSIQTPRPKQTSGFLYVDCRHGLGESDLDPIPVPCLKAMWGRHARVNLRNYSVYATKVGIAVGEILLYICS